MAANWGEGARLVAIGAAVQLMEEGNGIGPSGVLDIKIGRRERVVVEPRAPQTPYLVS